MKEWNDFCLREMQEDFNMRLSFVDLTTVTLSLQLPLKCRLIQNAAAQVLAETESGSSLHRPTVDLHLNFYSAVLSCFSHFYLLLYFKSNLNVSFYIVYVILPCVCPLSAFYVLCKSLWITLLLKGAIQKDLHCLTRVNKEKHLTLTLDCSTAESIQACFTCTCTISIMSSSAIVLFLSFLSKNVLFVCNPLFFHAPQTFNETTVLEHCTYYTLSLNWEQKIVTLCLCKRLIKIMKLWC